MSYNPLKAPHSYQGIDTNFVTPSDVAGVQNVAGKRFIQVNGAAGTVTFRHKNGTLSAPIDLALNQSFELGSEMVNIMATGTTATEIATYF